MNAGSKIPKSAVLKSTKPPGIYWVKSEIGGKFLYSRHYYFAINATTLGLS